MKMKRKWIKRADLF